VTASTEGQGGSQVERTILAWDRTALALLGNGALLLVRDVRVTGGLALVAAAGAVVAALVVAVLGRHRARTLRCAPAHAPASVAVAGGAVLAIGVVVTVVLLVHVVS
jgi:uncharacterized membrane protein YidH (DUF202 family)